MCGVCGIVSLDGSQPDMDAVTAMSRALVHRGPDSDGVLAYGSTALAARRLAVIDLPSGDQPIQNEDRSVAVVQNGEIYNYRELRAQLQRRGHRFRTLSDTEVLVHLYEERGVRFAEDLRGMFAIAVWDESGRRLTIARDRFGIKPLYYAVGDGRIVFASELKSLLRAPGVGREIDPDALEAFLAFGFVPAPMTIISGVRKLPAGHLLVWEGGEPRVEPYARAGVRGRARIDGAYDQELGDELLSRMRASVRAHLVSDTPVGVLLSGGVDSSTLVALAAQEVSEPVRTFSIGFEERSFNELDQARLVARRYGTDHHELVVRPRTADLLPRLAAVYDEPFADSSALPTYLVSEFAAQSVKVAFSGEGGDEVFGGYYAYAADVLAPVLGPGAARLGPLIDRLPASGRGRGFEDRLKRFAQAGALPAFERHLGWTQLFSAEAREELLVADRRGTADPRAVARTRWEESAGADELARCQGLDLGFSLVDGLLTKVDRASMAHSLEVRVPFLDEAVVELGLSLPRAQKVSLLAKKRLFRRAAEPLLPTQVTRAPKRGFSPPAAAWLRGELEPLLRNALSPSKVRRQGWFRPSAVTALVDAHVSRKRDLSRQLWGLLMFSLWHDHYGD